MRYTGLVASAEWCAVWRRNFLQAAGSTEENQQCVLGEGALSGGGDLKPPANTLDQDLHCHPIALFAKLHPALYPQYRVWQRPMPLAQFALAERPLWHRNRTLVQRVVVLTIGLGDVITPVMVAGYLPGVLKLHSVVALRRNCVKQQADGRFRSGRSDDVRLG